MDSIRIVPEKYQATAMGMVVTGTSIAMIFGLPLGRSIGLLAGWRSTFLCIAIVSFITLAYLAVLLPKVSGNAPFNISDLPRIYKNPVLPGLFLLNLLIPTAYYTAYSYIEPFLLQIGHFPDNWVTVILTIFGAAGLLGSYLFSHLYNAHRYSFLPLSIGLVMMSLFLLLPASSHLTTIISLCILWGISVTAFNVTGQAEVIQSTDSATAPVAMSLLSGIYNLGIGSGTWLGGAICSQLSIAYIGYAGAALSLIALLFCLFFMIPAMKKYKR